MRSDISSGLQAMIFKLSMVMSELHNKASLVWTTAGFEVRDGLCEDSNPCAHRFEYKESVRWNRITQTHI